ncbi:N-acetylmuramoyl-L-alanine amidase [uncultured Pseudoflavonifractor sp.]|uniref:N-acetylmuramoyl-L-alanine amidase n=1 Tax=uncultured Pseudoflavonifractor sp. TaxID=1221379 RepID=UPI0025F45C4E|nr:N-acetylmuramoyl-L-alanine amidase [uncultured Pseudoflavonifractor sp.]
MKNAAWQKFFSRMLALLVLLSGGVLLLLLGGEDTDVGSVLSAARFDVETVIIDAGHGGEDGGAVSVTGVPESGINLAIAKKLDLLFGLYGVRTELLRTEDVSLHDSSAETLREKKASDLHNRVARIEEVENATLISIHQNIYQSAQYHGAQVFYADSETSLPLAQATQNALRLVDPDNTRKPAKISENVYLMNHITCRAILVECGFLSNPEEELLLQSPEYQLKLAGALCGAYLQYQDSQQGVL